MSKIHIIFEDNADNEVSVRCISDRALPMEVSDWTAAELLARQTAEAIDTLMKQTGAIDAE